MLKTQATALHKAGLELLSKAKKSLKASEVKAYTDLGMKCLQESREIIDQLKSNSILAFIECGARVGTSVKGRYGDYLNFCARNGMEIMAEEDFEALVGDIMPQ